MFDIFKIVKELQKQISKKDILISISLLFGYFTTRIINLTSNYPIFTDEGIYINWAKIAWHDASWRFISLTDGRQPLQTWLTIPFLKLFPNDPLFAGRLFGVLGGMVALFGVFVLTYYLFDRKTAYIASVLYILTPFFLFYDRLAMVDSFVNAVSIWIFFFSFLLINTLRLEVALLFGLFGGMALLAKSSVSLFLGLSLFAPLIKISQNRRSFIHIIINYSVLFSIVIFLSVLLYNIQRLSPYLHFVGEKNKTFILTVSEFMQNPFQIFWGNIGSIPYYIIYNLGIVPFLYGIIGFIIFVKRNVRTGLYFALWIIIPYILISFFNRVLFPRYLIFLLTPFIIFAAYFITDFFSKKTNRTMPLYFLIFIGFVFSLYFNYTIIFDYQNIPFPTVDRGQYIEDWPSGYGAAEIVEFARQQDRKEPVVLLAEGNFGMAGDVLNSLLKPTDKITIKPYWPLEKKELLDNQALLKGQSVYVVFSHRSEFPKDWPIKLILKYPKPGNRSALYLFELLSNQ